MKVYIDLVLILNFSFDFLLLLTVSIVLKRHVKFYRLILGALLGSFSILSLFIHINSFELFLLKLVVSILMNLVAFGYKNIKYTMKNLGYLYFVSILLGGFLYLLNVEFSYKQEGLVFYHKGLSINFILLIIMSPIILYIYIRQAHETKIRNKTYYPVTFTYQNKRYEITGFLDTGNTLKSPYSNKSIIILNPNIISDINNPILIPIQTISEISMLPCIKVEDLKINHHHIKNVLVGISKEKIKLDGIECILNQYIMEEIK